ncbi:MAG: hypothetical protein COC08_06725 [Maribacter sp.]|nr:MAG: hypothetical protein COC08_06725 [Maribacter sp.]
MELVIGRKKQFADALRKYDILINGKKICKIEYGDEHIIEVEKGDILKLEIDWCSSNEMELSSNIEIIEVLNSISNLYFIVSAILLPILFYFGFTSNNLWLALSPVLLGLYPLLKLTIDKKKLS